MPTNHDETNDDGNYTFPVRLTSEDRELIEAAYGTYGGNFSRHRLLQEAIRWAMEAEKEEPGTLGAKLARPRGRGATSAPRRAATRQNARPKASTAPAIDPEMKSEIDRELEELGTNVADNPFL